MKILFIVENGLQESLGIAALSSAIRSFQHEVDLILFSHTPDVFQYLQETRPDLIGFSIVTGSHEFAYRLGKIIREKAKIPTIAGGPHATFYASHLAASDAFDYICRGEGEEPLSQLLNNLAAQKDDTQIPGIWALKGNQWYKNGIGPLIGNLDSRPIPDRSAFYKYPFLRNMSLKRFVVGIGCPYPCTFCHSVLFKREVGIGQGFLRYKSPEYVVREIQSVRKIARLDNIHFSDDTFGHNISWLEAFSKCFKREIGLPFTCNARADTSLRVIRLLKEAGCRGVQIGLESGSQRIRKDLLKKLWSNEEAIEVCRAFRREGMKIMATNILNLPSESLEEAWSTIEFNARCKVDYARCNIFLPHPALDLTKWAMENGYLKEDFSLQDFCAKALNPVIKSTHHDEFINLANLFSLAVKHKSLRNAIKNLLNRKPNFFFTGIGSLNLLQDFFFFNLKWVPSISYFWNTMGTPWNFKYGAWPTDRV